MSAADWIIVAAYFSLTLAMGAYFARRAGRSTNEFFLGGRRFPWWLAGLSMVATTFAADTPLAVTELVATRGIAGNWLWWNMAIGGMLTVFFFARLWRRAGVMTDLEIIEIRYSGKAAAFLRGFRSVYLGLFMNAVIMGWVNLAMASILEGLFSIPRETVMLYLAAALLFTALYSSLAGLWGVAVTDAFQFIVAMAGCIVLDVIVLHSPEIGGIAGLKASLPANTFEFLPRVQSAGDGVSGVLALSGGAFLAYIGVQWWASWYPGAEPGGGGYVAQRMMSARDEKQSVYAVLFFQIAHYCLRPWPWILVGLASLALYPSLPEADKRLGFVYAMRDYLPVGVKGLLVAAFFAAYMSTIATHLNWGTSYLVHDFWRRFVRRDAGETSYVRVSRITTMFLMLASMLASYVMTSISGAWMFLIECGAGLGLVLILRWYWWRINAWSEIVATVAPIVAVAVIAIFNGAVPAAERIVFPWTLFIPVMFTTVAWITATFWTAPTSPDVLAEFYRRTKPGGPLLGIYSRGDSRRPFMRLLAAWAAGVLMIYSALFATGCLLLGPSSSTALWICVSLAAGLIVFFLLRSGLGEAAADSTQPSSTPVGKL